MKKQIVFLFAFLTLNLVGQESNKIFVQKKNQHSISVEYLTAAYAFAKKLSNNKIFGVRIKVGFAKKFNLIPNSYEYTYWELQEPEIAYPISEQPDAITKTANIEFFDDFDDLIYLQFFQRLLLSDNFFLDYGLYTNLGFFDKQSHDINDGLIGIGISSKLFYNIRRFHIGTGVDGGYNFILDPSISKGFFGLYFTPVMLGYHF